MAEMNTTLIEAERDQERTSSLSRNPTLAQNASIDSIISDSSVEGTKIRVSSKHLTLSSRYFEKRLKSCWPEGSELQYKGQVTMTIFDWNKAALLMVLKIMHCKTRKVLKFIDLNLLCEIAVLVDYIGCHEAVEMFAAS
ncbi:hypothetical protein ASPWEDRAFT_706889 [Aspergillus wentii DTO 134E9]|uniref:BTB domain-containing protein n=1 Tax=Aspergillus wentii DTO 134E9 TaxID=1073089 RepID=A0A1L9R5Z5_ASPWE|nr:uncharacterized protein ASPWEDRAFT_706889 [Aspergillus wentii DTO 134E9]OJJ30339.1 hypothetical protein ASPWEDRAFT_706889 [Aspergillus wentii DTO 134E9]